MRAKRRPGASIDQEEMSEDELEKSNSWKSSAIAAGVGHALPCLENERCEIARHPFAKGIGTLVDQGVEGNAPRDRRGGRRCRRSAVQGEQVSASERKSRHGPPNGRQEKKVPPAQRQCVAIVVDDDDGMRRRRYRSRRARSSAGQSVRRNPGSRDATSIGGEKG